MASLENSLADIEKHIEDERTIEMSSHNCTLVGNNHSSEIKENCISDNVSQILPDTFRSEILRGGETEPVECKRILENNDEFVSDVFNKDQENELKEIILELGNHFMGITESEIRRIAFEYAEMNGVCHSFDKKTRQTTEKWYLQFVQAYPHLNYVISNTKKDLVSFQEDLHNSLMKSSGSSDEVVDKFICDYKDKKDFPKSVQTEENNYQVFGGGEVATGQSMEVPELAVCNNQVDTDLKKSTLTSRNDAYNMSSTKFSADLSNSDMHLNLNSEAISANFNYLLENNKSNCDNIPIVDKISMRSEVKITNEGENSFADLNLDEIISSVSAETIDGVIVNKSYDGKVLNESSGSLVDAKLEVAHLHHNDSSNNFPDPSMVDMTMENSEGTTNNEKNSCATSNSQENSGLSYERCLDPKKLDGKFNLPVTDDRPPPSTRCESTSEDRPREHANLDNFENSSLESGSYVSCVSPSHYETTTILNSDIPAKCEDCWNTSENLSDNAAIEVNTNESTAESANPLVEGNSLNFSESPLLVRDESNFVNTPGLESNSFNDHKDSALLLKENDVNCTELLKNTSGNSLHSNEEISFDKKDTQCTDSSPLQNVHEPDPSKNDHGVVMTNNDESANIFQHTRNSLDSSSNNSELTSNIFCSGEKVVKSDVESSCVNVMSSHEPTDLINATNRLKSLNGASTLKRKVPETVDEKGNHIPRKKMKISKNKGQKSSSMSRAKKPKKSIYLYKLKSYSGSELHFTSPTSVTFIKPVITLTKLDDKKYANPSNDESPSPVEESFLANENSESTPPQPSSTTSEENVDLSLKEKSIIDERFDAIDKDSAPIENEEKMNQSVKEVAAVEKKPIPLSENLTPTFTMQTRKKRLKFLPDGTLVTPKQESALESPSPSQETKNSKKRSFKRSASLQSMKQAAEKNSKMSPDERDISKPLPKEAKNIELQGRKMEVKPSVQSSSKFIPNKNMQYKKPQKIFDYDSYYREKSSIEGNNEATKNALPTSHKKHKVAVALSRVKSISESAKSGQLVVNPAQLLSCLLGTPITPEQICTVRFKPSVKKQLHNNQVGNTGIKPATKRQLELLQNAPLNIFPKVSDRTATEKPCKRSKSSKNHEIRNSL